MERLSPVNVEVHAHSVRILHVVWYSSFGGVENYTRTLFSELEKRGHHNVVIVAGNTLDGVVSSGRAVYHVPEIIDLRTKSAKPLMARLAPILERESPDVAYLHTALNGLAASAILRTLPTTYFAHNYTAFSPSGALYFQRTGLICGSTQAPNWRCLFNAYFRRCNTRRPDRLLATYRRAQLTRKWTLKADAVICDSSYVAERHALAGFHRSRLHVLPSPVLIPDLDGKDSQAGRAKSLILFCGRLVSGKGLAVLIRALPAVTSEASLVVAGDGPARPELARLATELKVASRIEFRGQLSPPQLTKLYQDAAVVVVPSLWPEPLGMVGPEALSYSRPVVGSGVGGMPEWLIDGVTGLVAAPGNVLELAGRINRVLSNPELADRLGRSGRQLVERRFSFSGHVDELLEVFKIAQAKRRSSIGAN